MAERLTSGRRSLRAEEGAAMASASLVLGAPLVVAALLRVQPERAVVVGWVSGPAPDPLLAWLAGAATMLVPTAPFAALAAWRTHVHASHWRAGQRRLWRLVTEPVVAGALLPVVVLLPVAVSRGLAGGLYVASYALFGALVGLAVGLLLAAVTAAVLFTPSRLSPGPD